MKVIPEIEAFLSQAIADGDFPGAVYLVARNQEVYTSGAKGHAVIVPDRILMTTETIFDMASVTKPLVTGMLLAQFIEKGIIALETPVYKVLPQFEREDKRGITIGQLATHCAGFPAWQPFYLLAEQPTDVIDLIAQWPLEYAPGTSVIYSDFSYITLGFLLARLGGNSLDDLARQMIFAPLKLMRTGFKPDLSLRLEIAAAEAGNRYEERLAQEKLAKEKLATSLQARVIQFKGWRSEVIWGQVHDMNAYFLGGVAGHAGLFSTAQEVYRMACQFLPGSRLLKPETLALFSTNFTPGCSEGRSLGWLLASVGITAAGATLSPSSFGHVGFTGTSLWIDPETVTIYILLTNRTHPEYRDFNMNERRRRFHACAQAAWE